MSGINSGHHYLPTYEMGLKSEMLNMCGIVMESIRDFSMSSLSTHISNCDDIGQC